METKKGIINGIFLLAFIMSISPFISAVTYVQPDEVNENVTGTFVFNVSISAAFGTNATNCTFATTADGIFAITQNKSLDQVSFPNSTDTSTLTDARATTLTSVCFNSTTQNETVTRVINIDNTAPVCSFTIDRDAVERQDGIGVTIANASTDTTIITLNYTIYTEDLKALASSIDPNPTFSNGDLEELGNNNITLTVIDAVALTTSCELNLLVTGSGGGDSDAVTSGGILGAGQLLTQTNIIIGVVVLIVVIILILGGFAFLTNKVKG